MRVFRVAVIASCLGGAACVTDPDGGPCSSDACEASSDASGVSSSASATSTTEASSTVASGASAEGGSTSASASSTEGSAEAATADEVTTADQASTAEGTSEGAQEVSSGEDSTDDAPSSTRMVAKPIGTTDAELGYWEYLPPGYGAGESSPLLVFFHGASWTGEGTAASLDELLEVGPPNLIATDAWPSDRPFVVLSPQWQAAGCLEPDAVDAFLRYALDHYEVDAQRVYLTAQSCGATGSWNYLAQHTDEIVAAAVLISGDGRSAFEAAGCELGRVPLWGLHNELDPVDSAGTSEPLAGLLACEPTPDVQLTIFPGETEHDAWTKTYDLSAGHDVYGWMLERAHP